MSTREMRSIAPRVGLPAQTLVARSQTLADRLEAADIKVLDDDMVTNMMEAARFGLPPETSRAELDTTRWGGSVPFYDGWTLFDYGEYCKDPDIQKEFGGAPPFPIRDKVSAVRKVMPDAAIVVYAIPEDPFIRVFYGDESCWIAGWSPNPVLGFCVF